MKLVWNARCTGRSLIAVAAMTLGVATAAMAQQKKTLVFVVNGASDFWKIAEAGVKKAQGELPKYNLQFKYPEQAAAAVQQRVMEDLVAAGAAGIMVSSVDPKNQTDGLNKVAGQTLLLHDRLRRAEVQARGLHRLVERRARQGRRQADAEGAAQGRQVHRLRRPARCRQRARAHRRRARRRSRARRSS